MSSKHEHQIKELQRQVKGMQRQINVEHAVNRDTAKKHEQRIRDLEIKSAVQRGAPQKRVAEIYQISPGRVSQIVNKVA